MIKVGEQVFVIPAKSLKFAGQWGEVILVNQRNYLPLLVKIMGSDIPYWFDYNEVVSSDRYQEIVDLPTFCGLCGTDITGKFVEICENCEIRQFEEDIARWQESKR